MSDLFDYDLVCIGSGPAGQRAAVQAAELGKRAAAIEKRRSVGCVCIDPARSRTRPCASPS